MPRPSEVQSQSVQTPPAPTVLLVNLIQAASDVPSWWSPSRDRFLADFWPTEPYLAGAIYSVASRNASYRFVFEGIPEDIDYAQRLFAFADFGQGWPHFMMSVTIDLLTQDNGAFIEVIRPARARTSGGQIYDAARVAMGGEMVWAPVDSAGIPTAVDEEFELLDYPGDLPVGLAHLDAARCRRTGDPDFPIEYTDQRNRRHLLTWWQVITLEDLPSPREEAKGVGYCAVSRVLRAAQVLNSITTYKHEKVSGRFARAIHLTNVGRQQILDALATAEADADARLLARYSQPIVVDTIDPKAEPRVATLELATLPDAFDEEESLRWYIACLALGFGVDYTYLAPLPGGGLGTATQVESQERQARGKSSRLFMKMLEYKFNYSGILPDGVTFRFQEVDTEEERARTDISQARAQVRRTMIEGGEISPRIARQIAVDQGELAQKYLEMLAEEDVTPERVEGEISA